MIIDGRLLALYSLLSSSLKHPGLSEFKKCACIMHDAILMFVSLSTKLHEGGLIVLWWVAGLGC